jgi:hypothetical protein
MIKIKKRDTIRRLPQKFRAKVREDWDGLEEVYDGKYDPENDGYSIFVQNGKDDLLNFPHLNAEDKGLYGRPWEGVAYFPELGLYSVVILCNNQFGLTVYFDEEGLDPILKTLLDEEKEAQ